MSGQAAGHRSQQVMKSRTSEISSRTEFAEVKVEIPPPALVRKVVVKFQIGVNVTAGMLPST